MVAVLVVITICLFCLLEWISKQETETGTVSAKGTEKAAWPPELSEPAYVGGFKVQREMAYHPGHAWAFLEGPARVRVGMDDFAHRLVGKVDKLDLPKAGDLVEQGEAAWTLHHGGRKAEMLSPVTGEVIEVNAKALECMKDGTDLPYTESWLFRVRTRAPRANMNNLLRGDLVAKWMETIAGGLRVRMNPGLAVSFPDGGPAVKDIGALIPDEQWSEVVREFLLTDA